MSELSVFFIPAVYGEAKLDAVWITHLGKDDGVLVYQDEVSQLIKQLQEIAKREQRERHWRTRVSHQLRSWADSIELGVVFGEALCSSVHRRQLSRGLVSAPICGRPLASR